MARGLPPISPHSRPSPLHLLATLLLATGCSPGKRSPNVILVVVDTLRANHLGTYGYARPTSPTIDRLASEGVLFEDVTAQSSWTRPSMVSLFGGRHVTAPRDLPFEEMPTLAERFSGAGYRTHAAVANMLLSGEAGFDRGFDTYDESTGGGGSLNRLGRKAPQLVADILATLDGAPDTRPLFAYLHLMEPHHPYEQHREWHEALPPAGAAPLEAGSLATYRELAGTLALEEASLEAELRQLTLERNRYDREIRAADAAIEQLLAGLESRGLLENTIVALVSDHGEGLFEHPLPAELWADGAPVGPRRLLQRAHGLRLHQNLIATPLLLWGAGVPAGVRVSTPVENVDLFPTLLELCDLAGPEHLTGQSLVPLMDGRAATSPQREHVFSLVEQELMVREVETGWKLVLPRRGLGGSPGDRPRLYDLGQDPGERFDLHGQHPDVEQRLRLVLERWELEHSTESTLGRTPTMAEVRTLRALGYIGPEEVGLPGAARPMEAAARREQEEDSRDL